MLKTVIGLLILLADVWAIINVIQSSETTGKKALWVVVILIFPIVGLIVWYLLGPKKA